MQYQQYSDFFYFALLKEAYAIFLPFSPERRRQLPFISNFSLFSPQKEEKEKGGAVLAVILFAERNKRFLTLAARVNTIDTDNTRPEISI
jgi:hypothetical protein